TITSSSPVVAGDTSLRADETQVATAATAPHGSVQTRDEALRALSEVATYFRRTEPHSPLSYAAEQLVRWGRLPLPELLTELIPDNASRDYLFTLVGMDLPPHN